MHIVNSADSFGKKESKHPAVFTIIQYEPDFFPVWVRHYLRHFLPEEVYVLHHELPEPRSESQASRKASWDSFLSKHHAEYGYNLLPVRNDKSFDHEWLRQTVVAYQEQLLSRHEWVLFTEADEIVAPHPCTGLDLKSFASHNLDATPTVVTDGYEVVQSLFDEPPLDLDRPLLPQRKWWYWSKMYSKPLLSRVPCRWCWGFHACDAIPIPYHRRDPNLVLIHLHKIDWNVCLRRHQANADRDWQDGRFGFQNRLVDENRLRAWWTLNIDQKTAPATLVEIPEEYKSIV